MTVFCSNLFMLRFQVSAEFENEKAEIMSSEKQITRDNHYVPRFYLRQWSGNGNTIRCYNGIIRNEAMRGWRSTSIKGTAYWKNLYTDIVDGYDDDKFEKMMHDYEDAAKEALCKLVSDAELSEREKSDLVSFLIVQAARTPSFVEFSQRLLKRVFPSVVESVGERLKQRIADGTIEEEAKRATQSLKEASPDLSDMVMNVRLDKEKGAIGVETCTGRQNFIAEALRFIEGAPGELLRDCNWIILNTEDMLMTSDNPVVFMQYDERSGWAFGLGGGLISRPTLVFMPLTPHHVLLTQIGLSTQEMERIQMTDELNELIQQGTVFNAKRYIYANNCDDRASAWREQFVNSDVFDEMERERKEWHEENKELEASFDFLVSLKR